MSRRALLAALAAGAAALPGLAGCDNRLGLGAPRPAAFNGVDVTGADYGRDLSLPDTDGRTRTLADFAGKVTLVFFGYLQCPDVCPTTMAELAQIRRSFEADGARLQAVFVTLDPERDTPAVLKRYVGGFDPTFVALRGTPEQTVAAAKSFRVYFSKAPGKGGAASYTIDHTAGAYVIDARGRLRLFERYGTPADAMRADLKRLLDGA
jgi:protein SCO1/2